MARGAIAGLAALLALATPTVSSQAERAEPVKFTVSASGDLLMHQPLIDRALANGGGHGYDFAPFFNRIAALRGGGRPRSLPHGDADGAGSALDLSALQHAVRPRRLGRAQRLGRV